MAGEKFKRLLEEGGGSKYQNPEPGLEPSDRPLWEAASSLAQKIQAPANKYREQKIQELSTATGISPEEIAKIEAQSLSAATMGATRPYSSLSVAEEMAAGIKPTPNKFESLGWAAPERPTIAEQLPEAKGIAEQYQHRRVWNPETADVPLMERDFGSVLPAAEEHGIEQLAEEAAKKTTTTPEEALNAFKAIRKRLLEQSRKGDTPGKGLRSDTILELPGQPTQELDVYHGTPAEFPKESLSVGEDQLIHVTPHKEVARIRAADMLPTEGALPPVRLIGGKLKVKNPVTIEDVGNFSPKNIINQLRDKEVLSADEYADLSKDMARHDVLQQEAYSKLGPDSDTAANQLVAERKQMLTKLSGMLKSKGYDPNSYKYYNTVEKARGSKDLTSFGVLNPEAMQITGEEVVPVEHLLGAAQSRALSDEQLIERLKQELTSNPPAKPILKKK